MVAGPGSEWWEASDRYGGRRRLSAGASARWCGAVIGFRLCGGGMGFRWCDSVVGAPSLTLLLTLTLLGNRRCRASLNRDILKSPTHGRLFPVSSSRPLTAAHLVLKP